MTTIILASNNKDKVKEVKEILKGYNVISLKDAGINLDVEENGTTFEENALIKARLYANLQDSLQWQMIQDWRLIILIKSLACILPDIWDMIHHMILKMLLLLNDLRVLKGRTEAAGLYVL